jgi:hypothetical protein
VTNVPENTKSVPPERQPQEPLRYEKPTVTKIGNMSANTKQKTVD